MAIRRTKKRELRVFLGMLAGIFVTFGLGVLYLRLHETKADAVIILGSTSTKAVPTGTIVLNAVATSSGDVIKPAPTGTLANDTKPQTIETSTKATAVVSAIPAPKPAPAAKPAPTSTPLAAKPAPAPAPTPAPPSVKTLPYSIDTFASNQGWENWWGNFKIATTSLTIGARSTDAGGGGVLLHGTNAWMNYIFTTTFDWNKGKQVDLFARYTNSDNYVDCEFVQEYLGDVHIVLRQFINGDEYRLATGDVFTYEGIGTKDIEASIQVQDAQAVCTFAGHSVSIFGTGNTVNPPFTGRIGISTWDPAKNNSQITVRSIEAHQTQGL